jgi:hypothetical protein
MDPQKLFFFGASRLYWLKISPHLGLIQHVIEHRLPLGTFRMVGTWAVICVARVLDDAGSVGRVHIFSLIRIKIK